MNILGRLLALERSAGIVDGGCSDCQDGARGRVRVYQPDAEPTAGPERCGACGRLLQPAIWLPDNGRGDTR